jgi:hypothetical protein
MRHKSLPYAPQAQHTSAYVSIRQHTSSCEHAPSHCPTEAAGRSAEAPHARHTSAYVSIRQHTSAYVSILPKLAALLKLRMLGIRSTTSATLALPVLCARRWSSSESSCETVRLYTSAYFGTPACMLLNRQTQAPGAVGARLVP